MYAVLLCVGLMYCSIKEITPGNPSYRPPWSGRSMVLTCSTSKEYKNAVHAQNDKKTTVKAATVATGIFQTEAESANDQILTMVPDTARGIQLPRSA